MKKFLYNQRELLAIVVYGLILYGIVFYVVKPLYYQVVDKRNEIQEQVALAEIKAKTLNELPRIRQQYQSIEANRQNLNSILKKNEEVFLIENLEQLAEQTQNDIKIGVPEAAITSKSTQKTDKEQQAKSIVTMLPSDKYQKFSIVVSGNYQSIINFMEKLESLSYFSDVLSVDFRKGDSVNQNSENMFAPVNNQEKVEGEKKQNELTANISAVFYISE